MSATIEKFQAATLSLARAGSIKERLTDAYCNHLAFVTEEELPSELRAEFRSLGEAMTRERPLLRGEDSFRATVRKMSSDEAAEVASAVVRMFAAVSRGATAVGRVRAAKNSANVVALHVAEGSGSAVERRDFRTVAPAVERRPADV